MFDITARARTELGIVYILMYQRPIGNPATRHGMAQTYVGWASGPRELKLRLKEHRQGHGSRITRAFARENIRFDYVCFPGSTADEKRVKAWKNARKFVQAEAWKDRDLRRWRGHIPF